MVSVRQFEIGTGGARREAKAQSSTKSSLKKDCALNFVGRESLIHWDVYFFDPIALGYKRKTLQMKPCYHGPRRHKDAHGKLRKTQSHRLWIRTFVAPLTFSKLCVNKLSHLPYTRQLPSWPSLRHGLTTKNVIEKLLRKETGQTAYIIRRKDGWKWKTMAGNTKYNNILS